MLDTALFFFSGILSGMLLGAYFMSLSSVMLGHRIDALQSELREKNKALKDALENEIYLRGQIAAVPHDDHYRNCI